MSDNASPAFSPADSRHMALALQLARRGRYTAHPNPRVGCVIVSGDTVVGKGWHERTGEAHAEVHALRDAGNRAAGAVAYVTLEPCSHDGRTPPCTVALIAAGIREVVCAVTDPNPKVAGSGLQALRDAGIGTRVGLMAEAAEALNRGFWSRMQRGRPFVRLKVAASLDGATAMDSGESQWITGEAAREDVQILRAESGAIVTGIGTVVADDPSLTLRRAGPGDRQPLRVIVDSGLRTPAEARLLGLEGKTMVFCADDTNAPAMERAGATIRRCAGPDGRVDLRAMLEQLGALEINDALVESGPTLSGALLEEGLVDELVIYMAPHIMGSETKRMFSTPGWRRLADRARLTVTDLRRVGDDIRITATP